MRGSNGRYSQKMKRLLVFLAVITITLTSLNPIANANDLEFQKTINSHALIGLPEARGLGYDGAGQTIVIIDDGNQVDHPYLKDVIIDGNCTSRAVCGSDHLNPGIKAGGAHKGDGFHGSMVTGIIAGQANSFAPGGIAPKAKVISIDNTDGNTEGLILAMNWILEIRKKHNVVALSASIGAPNIAMSRGGPGDCSPGLDLEKKIKELISAGISVVFAAGNGGSFTKVDYPACLPDLISVGALTHTGEITEYTNISKNLTVMAPADIKSSNGSGSYFIGGGTSSATPVVAGVVALLKQANPNATPADIKKALQTSRKGVDDLVWGNLPVLDIPRAIEVIKSGAFQPRKIESLGGLSQSEQYQDAIREIAKLKEAKTQSESEAKAAASTSEVSNATIKSLGKETGMLIEHIAGCHALPTATGEQAEVQARQSDGSWKRVSSYVSWEKTDDCPKDNPTRWWAIIDVKESAMIRWSFRIGSNPVINTNEVSFVNPTFKSIKAVEDLKPTTLTCVKGKKVKKVTAINPKCPTGYKKK